MKNIFALTLVAAHALSAVYAAPQFVSQYEDDGRALTQSRSGNSVLDLLRDDKRFSRFVEVIEKERGLRDDLENRDKQSTIFAPTNEAFKRMESASGNKKMDMADIVRYHVAGESDISGDCLHAGALVPTNLKLKSLNDRHQRIRVFRFADRVWLNMRAMVVDSDLKAENGRIHAIDNILVPPCGITEMLGVIPSELSTTIAAVERVGLAGNLNCKERGVTMFAPSNHGWKTLGYANLKYLFSCAGQETEEREGRETCKGRKDLKKIIEYSIATDLAYTTDLMRKEKVKFDTLEGDSLEVCAVRHESNRARDEHKNVKHYSFVVNGGRARLEFSDGLSKNGVFHVVDTPLIPKSIKLPHERMALE